MSQPPKTALTNLNVVLPMLYVAAIVLSAAFASGTVVSVVAVGGGVLLGAYFAFGRNRSSRV
ncbi:hypothetical protein [Streptomyces salinarius]|uniref:hypothetical protein n=1 Tax=Streptomyces salinarius TaxID=2762598 RepID=UPI0013DD733A|nr:hypothetical protein [Streptomyces salinarius]